MNLQVPPGSGDGRGPAPRDGEEGEHRFCGSSVTGLVSQGLFPGRARAIPRNPPPALRPSRGADGEPGEGSLSVARDFTLEKYRDLCCCLQDRGFTPVTLSGHLRQPDLEGSRRVILRHDVDLSPKMALRMAELERELGIQATYYFRYPFTFDPAAIRATTRLGHEVGYHYEVLTKTRGDLPRALRLFGEELAAFREVCPIVTVAAHGGSRSPQDNRDIWNHARFGDFNLLGEAYLSLPDFLYFSDTGRTWSPRGKVRDSIRNGRSPPAEIRTTTDLLHWIAVTREARLSLNVHPARWPSGLGGEAMALGQDFLNNLVKGTFRRVRALKGSPATPEEPDHRE